MNLDQWLKQTVQCDKNGKLPSLKNNPLDYVSRQEMFNRRIANNLMFDEDIQKFYDDYLKWFNNEKELNKEMKGDDQC